MACLGILIHLLKNKYITSMSGMLFLMFVQGLFQFGAKVGKWEGYYLKKNYLDMSFAVLPGVLEGDGIGSLTLVFDSQILQLKSYDRLYPTL